MEIADPSKVAVLRLADLDEYTWRWKVWLPPGNWWLSSLSRDIPAKGVPNGGSTGTIAGGREILASVTIRKGAEGKWQFRAVLDSMQNGNDLADTHRLVEPLAPAQPRGASAVIAGDKAQQSFDPAQPVVLIRLRAHDHQQLADGRWRTTESPNPCEGIMVWIHRKP